MSVFDVIDFNDFHNIQILRKVLQDDKQCSGLEETARNDYSISNSI